MVRRPRLCSASQGHPWERTSGRQAAAWETASPHRCAPARRLMLEAVCYTLSRRVGARGRKSDGNPNWVMDRRSAPHTSLMNNLRTTPTTANAIAARKRVCAVWLSTLERSSVSQSHLQATRQHPYTEYYGPERPVWSKYYADTAVLHTPCIYAESAGPSGAHVLPRTRSRQP